MRFLVIGAVVLMTCAIAIPARSTQDDTEDPRRTIGTNSPLLRRAADLTRVPIGTHTDWRGESLPPLYNMALTAFRSGDNGKSIELLLALVDSNPEFPPATLMLGSVYFRLRRHEDAVHAFQSFLKHAPGELQRTRHLAHALYSLGRYEEARDHYRRVLARHATEGGLKGAPRSRALRGLGLSLSHLGELEEARDVLRRAVEVDPRDAESLIALARVLEEHDALAEAARIAARAQVILPFDPRPAYMLATLQEDLGNAEEAAVHRAKFEVLSPVDVLVRDLETRLLHAPRDRNALAELVRLHASIANADGVRSAIQRLRPASLDELILVLETCADLVPKASRAASERLRKEFEFSARAWNALADYYESVGALELSEEARVRSRDRAKSNR